MHSFDASSIRQGHDHHHPYQPVLKATEFLHLGPVEAPLHQGGWAKQDANIATAGLWSTHPEAKDNDKRRKEERERWVTLALREDNHRTAMLSQILLQLITQESPPTAEIDRAYRKEVSWEDDDRGVRICTRDYWDDSAGLITGATPRSVEKEAASESDCGKGAEKIHGYEECSSSKPDRLYLVGRDDAKFNRGHVAFLQIARAIADKVRQHSREAGSPSNCVSRTRKGVAQDAKAAWEISGTGNAEKHGARGILVPTMHHPIIEVGAQVRGRDLVVLGRQLFAGAGYAAQETLVVAHLAGVHPLSRTTKKPIHDHIHGACREPVVNGQQKFHPHAKLRIQIMLAVIDEMHGRPVYIPAWIPPGVRKDLQAGVVPHETRAIDRESYAAMTGEEPTKTNKSRVVARHAWDSDIAARALAPLVHADIAMLKQSVSHAVVRCHPAHRKTAHRHADSAARLADRAEHKAEKLHQIAQKAERLGRVSKTDRTQLARAERILRRVGMTHDINQVAPEDIRQLADKTRTCAARIRAGVIEANDYGKYHRG